MKIIYILTVNIKCGRAGAFRASMERLEPPLITLFACARELMNTLEFKHDLFHAAPDGSADCLSDVFSFRSRSTWKENKRSPSHV